jgi:DNA repair exonuclease SbcCD nuclease subunit
VLTADLSGRELAAPVFYPGSVERTSFAERDEAKGFFILEFEGNAETGGRLVRRHFQELPARPMSRLSVDGTSLSPEALERRLRAEFDRLPIDAVVQLRIEGDLEQGAERVIRSANLRRLHPETMTVALRFRPPGR